MATIAAANRRGETCFLIDARDSCDPASGGADGVDFRKLLWIRCGVSRVYICVGKTFNHRGAQRVPKDKSSERKLGQVLKTTDLILQSGGFGLVVLDIAGSSEQYSRGI